MIESIEIEISSQWFLKTINFIDPKKEKIVSSIVNRTFPPHKASKVPVRVRKIFIPNSFQHSLREYIQMHYRH